MKCTHCNGTGRRFVPTNKNAITGNGYTADCPFCNGTGTIEMTNEQWFCTLSTEEKAKWLYTHYVNARAEEFYGRPEKTLYDYQKWLVDVHKGIDGMRVG